MKFPPNIIIDEDKIKFLYRTLELLRLEHNEMGRKFREGGMSESQFRDYQRNDFEPRNQRLFALINNLKEKLDMFRDYGKIGSPSPNLVEARKIAEEGMKMTNFDKDINLKEI